MNGENKSIGNLIVSNVITCNIPNECALPSNVQEFLLVPMHRIHAQHYFPPYCRFLMESTEYDQPN
jgi:hypothetical protein